MDCGLLVLHEGPFQHKKTPKRHFYRHHEHRLIHPARESQSVLTPEVPERRVKTQIHNRVCWRCVCSLWAHSFPEFFKQNQEIESNVIHAR